MLRRYRRPSVALSFGDPGCCRGLHTADAVRIMYGGWSNERVCSQTATWPPAESGREVDWYTGLPFSRDTSAIRS